MLAADARAQSSMRQSQGWAMNADGAHEERPVSQEKTRKSKGGFSKIFRMIGRNKPDASNTPRGRSARAEDDGPLAPPPPLSYLVDRMRGDLNHNPPRHSSTASLPSTMSPRKPTS